MSEMIERVARAIDEAMFDSGNMPCCERQAFVARAAIEAMREPTDEMMGGQFGSASRYLFTEMIDAALSTPDAK